ncbi:PqqD family protein [Thermoanaerobacter kivui]|nr:PqqD family protein [Thermoanaerobacter kivui]
MAKKQKKSDNFMLSVPHYSKKIEWKNKNGKVIFVFYHNKLVERLVRLFVKKPETTTLELYEIGSTVWNLIDGKRNVYEMGQKLKERFRDSVEPFYDRLIIFMRYLNRRGWGKY